jgi:mannosyltransferase
LLATKAPRVRTALAGVVVLAAALRFSTLGVQSFWLDEAFTVELVRKSLGGVLHGIRETEGTPPLYYCVAWLWAKLFGTSEWGLRSLSALIGTATVPIAYAAGGELVSKRAGLVTALLVAVNPWLVWYSQEARSYALLVLLGAAALYYFARAVHGGSRRDVALWAALSALALLTHYFAVFLAGAEAIWLAVAFRRHGRPVVDLAAGTAAIAAVGAALIPLALDQRSGGRQAFITNFPRSTRISDLPKHMLAGELGGPFHGFVPAAGVFLIVAAWLLINRATRRERNGAATALALAAAAVAVPLVMSFTKWDYFFARNLIALAVPVVGFSAGGLAAARAGWIGAAGVAGLCAVWMVVNVAVPLDSKLQRDDWRGALKAMGTATAPRVVATEPDFDGTPLALYLAGERTYPGPGFPVREIDVIRLARNGRRLPALAFPGFRAVARRRTASYQLDRFSSPTPMPVQPEALRQLGPTWAAYLQEPRG